MNILFEAAFSVVLFFFFFLFLLGYAVPIVPIQVQHFYSLNITFWMVARCRSMPLPAQEKQKCQWMHFLSVTKLCCRLWLFQLNLFWLIWFGNMSDRKPNITANKYGASRKPTAEIHWIIMLNLFLWAVMGCVLDKRCDLKFIDSPFLCEERASAVFIFFMRNEIHQHFYLYGKKKT